MTEHNDDVWQRISEQICWAQGGTGTPTLQPAEKPLADLGLDSLKLIEIVYELETFYQLDVDEERLAELENIGDLIAMFTEALATSHDAAALKS